MHADLLAESEKAESLYKNNSPKSERLINLSPVTPRKGSRESIIITYDDSPKRTKKKSIFVTTYDGSPKRRASYSVYTSPKKTGSPRNLAKKSIFVEPKELDFIQMYKKYNPKRLHSMRLDMNFNQLKGKKKLKSVDRVIIIDHRNSVKHEVVPKYIKPNKNKTMDKVLSRFKTMVVRKDNSFIYDEPTPKFSNLRESDTQFSSPPKKQNISSLLAVNEERTPKKRSVKRELTFKISSFEGQTRNLFEHESLKQKKEKKDEEISKMVPDEYKPFVLEVSCLINEEKKLDIVAEYHTVKSMKLMELLMYSKKELVRNEVIKMVKKKYKTNLRNVALSLINISKGLFKQKNCKINTKSVNLDSHESKAKKTVQDSGKLILSTINEMQSPIM